MSKIMDKESRYLRQQLDCNCNDCFFMKRDFETLNYLKEIDSAREKQRFDAAKEKAIADAKAISEPKEREGLLNKAKKMTFTYRYSSIILYAYCSHFEKNVSFIPEICQIDTQKCFKHRKDG